MRLLLAMFAAVRPVDVMVSRYYNTLISITAVDKLDGSLLSYLLRTVRVNIVVIPQVRLRLTCAVSQACDKGLKWEIAVFLTGNQF